MHQQLSHLIRKQIFELQLPDRNKAFGMQQEIRGVFDEELLPLIDQVFTEISGPGEVLRINRLELNLGHIHPLKLREQLRTQLKTVLTEKLREARSKALLQLGSIPLGNVTEPILIQGGDMELDAVLQTTTASIPSLLETYFLSGELPWWVADNHDAPDMEALTEQLLEEQPEVLLQVVIGLLKQRSAAERMVMQLPEKLLRRLAELLWPKALQSAVTHRDFEAVIRMLAAALGLPNSLTEQHNGTSPLALMAAGAAARLVTPPSAHYAQAPPTESLPTVWLLEAAAAAANQTTTDVFRVLQALFTEPQVAKRLPTALPHPLLRILQQRLSSRKHSLPRSALVQLLEAIAAAPQLVPITETEALLLLQQVPATVAATNSANRVLQQLLETEPLRRVSVRLALIEQVPELVLLLPELEVTEREEETTAEEISDTEQLNGKRRKATKTAKAKTRKSVTEIQEANKAKRRKSTVTTEEEIEQAALKTSDLETLSPKSKHTAVIDENIETEAQQKAREELETLLEIFADDRDEYESEEFRKRLRTTRWGGLVLLGPYLPALFGEAGLLNENNTFRNKDAAIRGVFLLQYVCTGTTKAPEYALPLHKLLCGLPFNKSIPKTVRLTKKEKQEADDLLDAMAEQWSSLRSPNGEAIRQGFFSRTGIIERKDGAWLIRVQRTSLDILLDSLPWSISVIRLPWIQQLIQVEW